MTKAGRTQKWSNSEPSSPLRRANQSSETFTKWRPSGDVLQLSVYTIKSRGDRTQPGDEPVFETLVLDIWSGHLKYEACSSINIWHCILLEPEEKSEESNKSLPWDFVSGDAHSHCRGWKALHAPHLHQLLKLTARGQNWHKWGVKKMFSKSFTHKECECKRSKIYFWMAIVVALLQTVGLEDFIGNLTKLVSTMAQSAPTDGIGTSSLSYVHRLKQGWHIPEVSQ